VLCSLLYEQGDNTLAQVTVVPRTIRSFQAKPFSNTFQINRVLGNYSGIDCINLTDQMLYPNFRSEISLQRDAICMSARPDFLNFVCGLRKRDHHIDKTNVCGMLDMVRKFSPQGYSTVKEANLTGGNTGGTYVRIQDAFELDKEMRTTRSRNIRIYKTNSNCFLVKPFLPGRPI
jgi:hypothetical protein